jgi:hypothetical protein
LAIFKDGTHLAMDNDGGTMKHWTHPGEKLLWTLSVRYLGDNKGGNRDRRSCRS